MGDKGVIASTAGLAILLNEGIGDTIRVSLTPGARRAARARGRGRPAGPPVDGPALVPAAGVSACPGCGRTTSTFFQEMAQQIQGYLKDRMPEWRETHPGAEDLRVAVMGCVVNGPGESKHADIGISLPGTFEDPVAPGLHRRPARPDAPRRRASSRSSSRSSRPTSRGGSRPRSQRRHPDAPATRPYPRTLAALRRPPIRVYTPRPTERPLRDVGDPHVSF